MPKSAALLNLFELAQLLASEIEPLYKKSKDSVYIDASTTGQILRTLQSIRELSYLTSLPQTANIAQTLECIIEQISMGRLPFSPSLFKQCQSAINAMAEAIKLQEKSTTGSALIKINLSLEDSLKKTVRTDTIAAAYDITALGIGETYQELSPHETALIQHTIAQHQPIFIYMTNLRTETMDNDVISITNIINTLGPLIAALPTRATQPSFDYAFIFIFTSNKPIATIKTTLTRSGLLTKIAPPEHPQIMTIQGPVETLSPLPETQPETQQTPPATPTPITQKTIKQRLLLFTVADKYFALPFAHILEVLPFEKEDYQKRKDRMVYLHRHKELNAFLLRNLLPAAETEKSLHAGPETHNVIVLSAPQQTIALMVDLIIGPEETAMAKQEDTDKEQTLYAGQADFGNGKLAMIINVEKLYELVAHE